MNRPAPTCPTTPTLTRRRLVMALPLLGGVAWSPNAGARGAPQRASRALMGTQVDIVADGGDAPTLNAAIERAFAEMQRLAALMTRYQPDSAVSQINRAAGIHPVAVPPEVMAVLLAARRVSDDSGGAFDPTVGALKAWNFADGAQHTVPSRRLIERQRQLVDAQGLVCDPRAGTAFLQRRQMAIDLGGIAKLPILEAGLRTLQEHGVSNALVNGGGDVLATGLLQGRPWRVGLRDPEAPQRLLGVVPLTGGAVVASSGDYERFFWHQGRREHHILDPRTGWPTRQVHGVSLLARSAAEVNGLGAALMVQGLERGQDLLAGRPGVEALIVTAAHSTWRTAGMEKALRQT